MRHSRRRWIAGGVIWLLVFASATCGGGGGDSTGPSGSHRPASLAAVAGVSTQGEAGQLVPVPPGVAVKDAAGSPVGGVSVTFTIVSGGGSLSGATVASHDDGIARLGSWTLGSALGQQQVQAAVTGLTPVLFGVAVSPGPPALMTTVSQVNQNGPAGTAVTDRPKVKVTDQFNHPIQNLDIVFAVASGGGSVVGGRQKTDALGTATVGSWVLGTALGVNTMTATFAGLTPVTFSATGIVGPPASIIKLAGDNQTAFAGIKLPVLPSVRVVDAHNNPVAGELVFASSNQFSNVVANPLPTDATGTVAFDWRLGVPGPNTLTLDVLSGCCAVSFTGTSLLGPPAKLFELGGNQSTQVGTPVPSLIGFIVQDAGSNGVPGVEVTFSVSQGNGSLTGAIDTSDANGNVFVGSWTLDTLYKLDTLKVSVPGGLTGLVTAQGTPGPGVALVKIQGDNQTGGAATDLLIEPKVKAVDQYGNAAFNTHVIFQITSGGGLIQNSGVFTGFDGIASAGFWRLGPAPGVNTMRASIFGTATGTTFTATGVPRPQSISKNSGDNQSATVATQVATAPQVQVLDTQGQPIGGIPVVFNVTAGNGSVTGGTATTDAGGLASVGSWTLGQTAGTNTLSATVSGIGPVTFSATGTAGPATSVAAQSLAIQSQIAGTAVSFPPAVILTDQFGNPVAGVSVDFQVTGGGGSLVGSSSVVSGADGIAAVGGWILGGTAGANSVSATASGPGIGGNPVLFTATGLVSSYHIDLRYLTGVTPAQQADFDSATARLQRLIVNDEPDITLNLPAGTCLTNQPTLSETVDDVVIFAELVNIDGSGGILGQAGPCSVRAGSFHTIVGVILLDATDAASLQALGLLDDVILHEMQHVLGFGSIWSQRSIILGAGGTDPTFIGFAALAAFNGIGGQNYPGNKVPVENQGGAGTRDSHWRESVFLNELMTGFLNQGANPLSIVTVESFKDIGYQVNTGAADGFSIGPFPAPPAARGITVRMSNDVWGGPLYLIEANGTIQSIPRR
jgi:adhesin/invasin